MNEQQFQMIMNRLDTILVLLTDLHTQRRQSITTLDELSNRGLADHWNNYTNADQTSAGLIEAIGKPLPNLDDDQ